MSAQPEEIFDPITIAAVPANVIDLVWSRVEPLIRSVEALAPIDISTARVRDELRLGNKLLVTIARGEEIIAINVLDVRTLDSGAKVLYIPITAGTDIDSWLAEFLEVAEKIAIDYNCLELRGLAVRKGWLPKLKQYGWEEAFVTIRRKIGE
jgi:hypothetical protein